MIENVLIIAAFAIFSLGIAGIASSRNVVIMLLSVEAVFLSAALLAVTFFYFNTLAQAAILPLLFSIWGIAAAEIVVIIVFYKYLVRSETSLDVQRLEKLRE